MQTNSEQPGLVDFMISLLSAIIDDMADTCTYRNIDRWNDKRYIVRRLTCEGIGFITNKLPSLGKALDKALASDDFLEIPLDFKSGKETRNPVFLGSLFEEVFDAFGRVRSDANPRAVSSIRQITYLFYKLSLPYTHAQEASTVERFLQTEEDLEKFEPVLSNLHRARAAFASNRVGFAYSDWNTREYRILEISRRIIARVLGSSNPLDTANYRPRHGTGAVATGEKVEEKMQFKRYYAQLARKFPYDEHFFYNLSHLCDGLQEFVNLDELETGTAKVVLVPKDSRGPRLISCEPLEYQWIQQSLMANMVKTIESHPFTSGLVNFTSQEVNRNLAMSNSCGEGRMVTLDLKDASDRVHLDLVRFLFPVTWFEALVASRSSATQLPDGRVIQLRKFAPMGSATCFPVEALVFWAISTATIIHDQYTHRAGPFGDAVEVYFHDVCRDSPDKVYVYGDDIVCGSKVQGAIRQMLEHVGLKVNDDKCCTGRFFRESCGCDAFMGIDVTPLRQKAVLDRRVGASVIISLVAFHNALIERHFVRSASFLADELSKRIVLPRIRYWSDRNLPERKWGGLALLMPQDSVETKDDFSMLRRRFNAKNGHWEVYAYVPMVRTFTCGTMSWSEMLRLASYLTKSGEDDIEPFERVRPALTPAGVIEELLTEALRSIPVVRACQYTRARRVSLKRAWTRL